MNEITLSIDNRHLLTFLGFLKTLNYIEVKKVEKNAAPDAKANKLATLFSLYGAWNDPRSAEEIIGDLQKMRVFNRSVESL